MRKIYGARAIAPVLALGIIATAAVGVTYASSANKGVKACQTSKHVLVTANNKGKCPSGSSSVTIGKAGKTGKTGPSDGYVDTLRTPTALSIDHTLLTMTLPAGSYLLNANVGFSNTDSGQENPGCEFKAGGAQSIESQIDLQGQTGTAPITFPGLGNLSVSTGVKLTSNGDITLVCGASADVKATASMSAVKVGTLTVTGDSPFTG